ncbi:MAG: DNA primase [Candidatus Uhrbacteria bacterium]
MEPKDEIKNRLSVEEVVGEYLPLKPAGSGAFKACCPFHQEKTPSFHVSKAKQIWHCFGCDMGGDIFSFVMEMENTDFPEALRILGKKAGVEIPRFDKTESNERQRLISINELAAKYFRKVLTDSSGAANARAYLENRGLGADLAEKFQIGYAPDSWDSLVSFLNKRGFSAHEIEQSGLVLRKKAGPGFIDRFRNRIMVPLMDHHSNVVGFTGRILGKMDEKSGPKYMNSPETAIYKKSELLYGLNFAKTGIKEARSVIIVEGNLDVIASHKAGVTNVVASSGTALTDQQIDLLKRFTDRLIFSFDQDAAGFEAARRGIRMAQSKDLKVEVVILPPEAGKDPDDAVQKDPKLWQNAVSNPIPIMEYYFAQAFKGKDLNNVEHKREIGKFLVPEIASLADAIVMEHWMRKLSDLIKVDVEVIRGMIQKARGEAPTARLKKSESKPLEKKSRSREDKTIMEILGITINRPDLVKNLTDRLKQDQIPNEDMKLLYTELLLAYNSDQIQPAQQSFFANLRDKITTNEELKHLEKLLDEIAVYGEVILSGISPDQVPVQLDDYLKVIASSRLNSRKRELEVVIRQAEAQGDQEAVTNLINEYNALS